MWGGGQQSCANDDVYHYINYFIIFFFVIVKGILCILSIMHFPYLMLFCRNLKEYMVRINFRWQRFMFYAWFTFNLKGSPIGCQILPANQLKNMQYKLFSGEIILIVIILPLQYILL